MAVVPGGLAPFCALANLHTHRLAEIALGIDMAYRLIGEDRAQVGRDLPYCPEIDGIDAFVPEPNNRPIGTEPFQVRVVVVGDSPRLRFLQQGVNIARIFSTRYVETGRGDPGDPASVASVAIAQAEYYSTWEYANLREDGEEHSVEEDAFRTDWRARLRRWRIRTGAADTSTSDAAYDEFLEQSVLPECGDACDDVRQDLRRGRDALH
jgi:hypothetical protein